MKKKFNFMIGEDLENNLIIYCKKKKISYNLCVNYIIELMLPLIKKIHFFSEEDNCKYQQIKATKKIRAYIKEDIYRELKLVHSNLNFYSMAILVRMLLETFFLWLEEAQEDEKMVISKIKLLEMDINCKCYNSGYVIIKNQLKEEQLSHDSTKPALSIYYKKNFSIYKLVLLL